MKSGSTVWFVVSAIDYPKQEVMEGTFRGVEIYGEDRLRLMAVEDRHGEWWRLDPSRVFDNPERAAALARQVESEASKT